MQGCVDNGAQPVRPRSWRGVFWTRWPRVTAACATEDVHRGRLAGGCRVCTQDNKKEGPTVLDYDMNAVLLVLCRSQAGRNSRIGQFCDHCRND